MLYKIYNFLGDDLLEEFKEEKESYARSTLIGKKKDITMAHEALEVICKEISHEHQQ